MYVIKDIPISKTNEYLRKAYKYYDLRNIINIVIENTDDSRLFFNLVFSKNEDPESFETRSKKLYFNQENGHLFFRMIKYYFQKLNIPVTVNE
jgi:hypothetical protein